MSDQNDTAPDCAVLSAWTVRTFATSGHLTFSWNGLADGETHALALSKRAIETIRAVSGDRAARIDWPSQFATSAATTGKGRQTRWSILSPLKDALHAPLANWDGEAYAEISHAIALIGTGEIHRRPIRSMLGFVFGRGTACDNFKVLVCEIDIEDKPRDQHPDASEARLALAVPCWLAIEPSAENDPYGFQSFSIEAPASATLRAGASTAIVQDALTKGLDGVKVLQDLGALDAAARLRALVNNALKRESEHE
mgnify:CR=1 FL=1